MKREQFSKDLQKASSKLAVVDQQKLKLENMASELSSKRTIEAKRMDDIQNIKQLILSLETELEELSCRGVSSVT